MISRLAIFFNFIFTVALFGQSPMRTGTNEDVSTYGTSGVDYTDLNDWEVATDNDNVTATTSPVLEMVDDAANFDDNIDLEHSTNNSTYFRIVRAQSGSEHDGTSNNGVYVRFTGDNDAWRLREQSSGIQNFITSLIYDSSTGRSSVNAKTNDADQFVEAMITFDNSNVTSTSRGYEMELSGDDVLVSLAENCDGYGLQGDSGETHTWYNVTSVNNSTDGIKDSGTGAVVKNCLSDGSGGNDYDGTFDTGNSTNNASSDATAVGSSARTSQTFTFVNEAGNDYHLAAGDAGADNFGTDLSGDTPAFSQDIDGEEFDTWDIGIDENSPPADGEEPKPIKRRNTTWWQ